MERIVHICHGDNTAAALALVDLPGEIRPWVDALDQGPLLPIADDAHYRARGEFWAARGGGSAADIAQRLADCDRQLDDAARADELILWFDHNWYEQLALARLLARLARSGLPRQLTIVSIDRHPDVTQFIALAHLAPDQLAQRWARRAPLSRDSIDEANAAWIAVTAPDPRALPFVSRRARALPFLSGALERHLEELPDPTSGLSRTERELLAALARGVATVPGLVDAVRAVDPRYAISDRAATNALATLERIGYVSRSTNPVTTELGQQVLAGAIDRVAQHGIDDWRGGVRLQGTGPVWRWDARDRKLVER